ncbi:MAG: sulfotransferase domain-containing protein [Candidatus Thiodiazotropha weberae]|nr:sulfotransferase domain-containing protein [Candidatus Thiodiazotropha weberae]
MAYIQNSIFDKYRRYFFKYIKLKLQNFKLDSIVGRFVGPRVLLVSVPKSGTHMLEGILESMPTIRNSGWKTINNKNCSLNKIKKIKNGMFANSHLYYSDDLYQCIKENNIKVIFMIRDPRDIVVSRCKYIVNIDKLHYAHKMLAQLGEESKQITACIKGKDDDFPGIFEILEGFKGWLSADNVLTIKFENLVGAKGNGSDTLRSETIREIRSFLDIEISNEEIDIINTKLQDKDTSTKRKGLIGGWTEELSSEHVEYFERNTKSILRQYGYR